MIVLKVMFGTWAALALAWAALVIWDRFRSPPKQLDNERQLKHLRAFMDATPTREEAEFLAGKFKEPEGTEIPLEEVDFYMELDDLIENVQQDRRDPC